LVRYLIPAQSFGMIWGPPNIGKSFVTLDLACSLAAGGHWFGHDVLKPINVVYVSGEGIYGFRKRLRGWLEARGVEADDLSRLQFREKPVQLRDGIQTFMRELEDAQPKLVIFDTLASCNLGGDEDSTEGMGPVIEACLDMRKQLQAAILLVHHTGWEDPPKHERGSSALRGAVDMSFEIKGEKGWMHNKQKTSRTLICHKQRNGEKFDPIEFRMKKIAWTVQTKGQKAKQVSSLVPAVRRR
jgi:hypothetical protein